MLVNRVPAIEQRLEMISADGDGDRETDGAPQRVAAADPVPEGEHVLERDAELADLFLSGAEGDEMFADRGVAAELLHQPVARAAGVGQRFLRGEGLRRDDEQRGLGVEALERGAQVGAIDVRHEVRSQPLMPVRPQRLGHHHRPEVRPADADVDQVGERLAGVTGKRATAHPGRKITHASERRIHLRHHVFAIDQNRPIAAIAQRDVQHRSVLGDVDALAAEHRVASPLDVACPGQRHQQRERLVGRAVFRIIDQQVLAEPRRQLRKTVGVFGEQLAHLRRLQRGGMGSEGFPLGQLGERHGERFYSAARKTCWAARTPVRMAP